MKPPFPSKLSLIFYEKNWFKFQRMMLMVMTEREALIMSWLINEHYLKEGEGKCKKGFFYVSRARMQRDLFYKGYKKIQRAIAGLVNLGFVETKYIPKKNGGTNRFVKVQLQYLYDSIKTAYENDDFHN